MTREEQTAVLIRLLNTPRNTAARPLVIGEIGLAHDGSLGQAHAYIDAVAEAGADAVKFQTHIAEAESTSREPWRVPFSTQDATRFDYWARTAFTAEQWIGLGEHARERGLLFLSSPFSLEAVDWLERAGVCAWKVASGEVANTPLLARMLATRLPMLLSSGMSSLGELDQAVSRCRDAGVPIAVFQCTTAYPCPPDRIGLNMLETLAGRYGCAVGLSDHSGTIYAGLAAAALGATLIEVHVTFDRRAFGPDVPASLTLDELAALSAGASFIHRAMASPVDKDREAALLAPVREIFSRSIVASRDLPAGVSLQATDLAFKKPGGGLPASRAGDLVGRRLVRPIVKDETIKAGDLDPALS